MSRSLYRRFHNAEPGDVIELDDDDFYPEPRMILIGRLVGVAYQVDSPSDKGDDITYVHEFGEEGGEVPLLLAGESGEKLYILGGSYRVEEWIIG